MADLSGKRLVKLVKFVAVGLPSFLVAIPLNFLLVEKAGMPKAAAYALVMIFQVTINFFMCRYFVFERRTTSSLWKEFTVFFVGISMFRVLDWVVYNALVYGLGLYYIGVQILNVIMFAVFKFVFSEKVMQ